MDKYVRKNSPFQNMAARFVIALKRSAKHSGALKEKSSATHLIENVKNITEIAALVIAAAWALFNFNIKDKPGLEKSGLITSDLYTDSISPDKVHTEFDVKIKNIGKTSFDVVSVKVKYWLVPVSRITKDKYFVPENIIDFIPPIDSIDDHSLAAHYPPDVEYHDMLNFFLNRSADSTFIVRADVIYGSSSGFFTSNSWLDYTYSVQWQCVPNKKD